MYIFGIIALCFAALLYDANNKLTKRVSTLEEKVTELEKELNAIKQ